MTRDEYLHMLATEPATGTQVGAIIGEFERLGVDDRAERLTICAELLGLENLGSTTGLVMGQAGYLVNLLRRARDRGELPIGAGLQDPGNLALAAADDQGDDPAGVMLGEIIIIAAAAVVYLARAAARHPKQSR